MFLATTSILRKGKAGASGVITRAKKLSDGRVARRAPTHSTLNGYAMFLREQYKTNASLKTDYPDFKSRSKALHKIWTGLSAAQQEQYKEQGKRTPVVPHAQKAVKGNAWKAYVKANYSSVVSLPFKDRLVELRKKYISEKGE